jgi:hypothetical protein
MVCKPKKVAMDSSIGSQNIHVGLTSRHLRGGYLLNVSTDIIHGGRVLSTANVHNYDVRLESKSQAERLLNVMNSMQEVPFRINHPCRPCFLIMTY